MESVEFKLSREMRQALRQLANQDDVSPGQILRSLLNKEISRRQNARPPVRADERLLAPLRARLAPDLAHATHWQDLQERLNRAGYTLREAGGGLALHTHPAGARVCKASELGFSYSRLMRRFRAPFPGHAHSWLTQRFLDDPPQDADEDIQLVEPFDHPIR